MRRFACGTGRSEQREMYIFGLRNENNVRAPKAFGAIQLAFHKWTEISLLVQPTGTVFGLTLGFLTLSIMGPPSSKTSPPASQPVKEQTPLLEALVRELEAARQKNAAKHEIRSQNPDSLSIQ